MRPFSGVGSVGDICWSFCVMELPQVNGVEVLSSLGGGANGRVYWARLANGDDVALKVFHCWMSEGGELHRTTQLLAKGGWPDGVLPVLEEWWGEGGCYRIMPALLDGTAGGEWVPRSLQHHLASHVGGAAAETVIRGVVMALAGMHRRSVVHGNLKPSNVMFGKGGGVFLTDWGLRAELAEEGAALFSDAVLYQPVEQLRQAAGKMEKGVPGWDVFAFGVLAYRLLAGRFPRCDSNYGQVAPPSGRACGEVRMAVDREKLAANMCREPEVVWPAECLSVVDPMLRAVVERCLSLDAGSRPKSMVVVEEMMGVIGAGHGEGGVRRTWRGIMWKVACGVMAAVAVYVGIDSSRNVKRWSAAVDAVDQKEREMLRQEELWHQERQEWEKGREEMKGALAVKEEEVAGLREELVRERARGRVMVEASREIGDRLFVWAMERRRRDMPALEGRKLRIEQIERYVLDFLVKTEEAEGMERERATARMQLAELALAAGDEVLSLKRLDEACADVVKVGMGDEMRMRIAINRVLLAILKQRKSSEDAGEAIAEARRSLEGMPQDGEDAGRIVQMKVALDYHEARYLTDAGKREEAMTMLMRAQELLQGLEDGRMEVAVLRSDLAGLHLLSAEVQDGLGHFVEAAELRERARVELEEALAEEPGNVDVRLELAGCLAAMGEARVVGGEMSEAELLTAEAIGHVEEVLRRRPEDREAQVRRAGLLGLRAGLLRDRGLADEAKEDYGLGILVLERLLAAVPGPSSVSYRLADLLWQNGRMLGMEGKRGEEIAMMERAVNLLEELEKKGVEGVTREEVQRSAVYLMGDLGHSLQLEGQKDRALGVFRGALERWEALVRSRPESEEFNEGLVWCRQRVKELEE